MTSEDNEKQLEQLSLIEQNVTSLLSQRQNYAQQLNEVDSALKHLKNKKSAYKIVGNIMIDTTSAELQTELNKKKELLELRIKNLQKQEESLKQKAKELQEKVLKHMKK